MVELEIWSSIVFSSAAATGGCPRGVAELTGHTVDWFLRPGKERLFKRPKRKTLGLRSLADANVIVSDGDLFAQKIAVEQLFDGSVHDPRPSSAVADLARK